MARIDGFGETQDVEITVLVDNRADLLVKSTETVKRFTEEPLLAEHGFAALVDLKECRHPDPLGRGHDRDGAAGECPPTQDRSGHGGQDRFEPRARGPLCGHDRR